MEITSKVATYNMAAGMGMDGEYNLDRIADTISETGAEIVGLQEVDVHWGSRSQNENTIEILAEKLDMYYFFAPIYDMDPVEEGDPRRQYGVGVLSEYPILKASNREITRLSTQGDDPVPEMTPGFLEAEIDIDGESVWFYVTHLDYRGDPTVREMQIDDMFEIMSEHNYNILVGDMNARPEADELDPLFSWFDDAWDMNEEPGYTFPADSPDRRIDYVLTSPRMKVNSAHVTHSTASDHLPVTAEVTFVRGNNSQSIEEVKKLVNTFAEKGEFASAEPVHALNIHMTALSYFEEMSRLDKVIKHLDGLKDLLDHQLNNGLVTERVYNELYSDAEYLIEIFNDN
jgi:endonuclease/exonuclease/phosphatase family metal-dependent hydrolase